MFWQQFSSYWLHMNSKAERCWCASADLRWRTNEINTFENSTKFGWIFLFPTESSGPLTCVSALTPSMEFSIISAPKEMQSFQLLTIRSFAHSKHLSTLLCNSKSIPVRPWRWWSKESRSVSKMGLSFSCPSVELHLNAFRFWVVFYRKNKFHVDWIIKQFSFAT